MGQTTYKSRVDIESDGLLDEELSNSMAGYDTDIIKSDKTTEYSYETVSDIFKGNSCYWIADRCYKFESMNFFFCLSEALQWHRHRLQQFPARLLSVFCSATLLLPQIL